MMVDPVTKSTRAAKAAALEKWAAVVDSAELIEADTTVLRHLGEISAQRDALDADVRAAVDEARRCKKSWSEIGTMLGVSTQAAQRKYSTRSNDA